MKISQNLLIPTSFETYNYSILGILHFQNQIKHKYPIQKNEIILFTRIRKQDETTYYMQKSKKKISQFQYE